MLGEISGERQCRCRIACDDHGLDAFTFQKIDVVLRVASDGFARFDAVGQPGGIAQKQDRLGRELPLESSDHGEAAHTGIEDTDLVHPASRMRSGLAASGVAVSKCPASVSRWRPLIMITTRWASSSPSSSVLTML